MKQTTKHNKIIVLDSVTLTKSQWRAIQCLSEKPITILRGEGDSLNAQIRKTINFDNSLEKNADGKHMDEEIYCSLQMNVPHREMGEMVSLLRGADCVITCWTPVPNNVIYALEQEGTPIKNIAAWTNFVSGRIDLEYANLKNIQVSMIPDYGTEAVSQYVFAMIYHQILRKDVLVGSEKEFAEHFSALRSITAQMEATKSGQWRFEDLKRGKELDVSQIAERTLPTVERRGDALARKRLGVVGMGRVGNAVASIAQNLGMDVSEFSKGEPQESLASLFESCDIVSLHLPPDKAQGIVTPALISKMKPGSVLINTSVGNVIADERAMFEIAREKKISLFLDVYQKLPPLSEIKKTRKRDGASIIATYRNGWYTQEALMIKGWRLVQNILSPLGIEPDLKGQMLNEIDSLICDIRAGIGESSHKATSLIRKLEGS